MKRYANVKSKIDQSDPNPAHKLQHRVEDLTDLTLDSKQGWEINPRFSRQKFANTRPSFGRRGTIDYNDQFPHNSVNRSRAHSVEYNRMQKSASIDTPFVALPRLKLASTFPLRRELASKMSTVVEIEREPVPLMFGVDSIDEEDETEVGTHVSSELSHAHNLTKSEAFMEDEEECDDDSTSNTGIYDMEVTSNETETTVVLKHLLALAEKRNSANSSNSTDMIIMEEDELEEEYYESQDTPISTCSDGSGVFFTLPHPIPRLYVTCEGEGLVETVVENTRDYNTMSPPKVSPLTIGLAAEDWDDFPSTRL